MFRSETKGFNEGDEESSVEEALVSQVFVLLCYVPYLLSLDLAHCCYDGLQY